MTRVLQNEIIDVQKEAGRSAMIAYKGMSSGRLLMGTSGNAVL